MIIEIASDDQAWVNACNTWAAGEFRRSPEWFVSDQIRGNGVALWTLIHPELGTPDTHILVATRMLDALRGTAGCGYGLASNFELHDYVDLDDWEGYKKEFIEYLHDLGCSEEDLAWLNPKLMAPPNRR